jgi:hypothetical protein
MNQTNQAIDQVRDNNPEFYELALEYSKGWIRANLKPFTSEDIKKDFYKSGASPPREPSVWGAVFRQLIRDELIFKQDVSHAKNPQAHSRLVNVWISKAYREKQQSNAIKNKDQLKLL